MLRPHLALGYAVFVVAACSNDVHEAGAPGGAAGNGSGATGGGSGAGGSVANSGEGGAVGSAATRAAPGAVSRARAWTVRPTRVGERYRSRVAIV